MPNVITIYCSFWVEWVFPVRRFVAHCDPAVFQTYVVSGRQCEHVADASSTTMPLLFAYLNLKCKWQRIRQAEGKDSSTVESRVSSLNRCFTPGLTMSTYHGSWAASVPSIIIMNYDVFYRERKKDGDDAEYFPPLWMLNVRRPRAYIHSGRWIWFRRSLLWQNNEISYQLR